MRLNKAEVFEGLGVRRRKIKVGRDVAIQLEIVLMVLAI